MGKWKGEYLTGLTFFFSFFLFVFLCEFGLPSPKRQKGMRSSRKAYIGSFWPLFRPSDWISFLQIFILLGWFSSICWWWLKTLWVDMEGYWELVNDLKWKVFFYFGLYSVTSVRRWGPSTARRALCQVVGKVDQGLRSLCADFGLPALTFAWLSAGCQKKKKKGAKRGNLKDCESCCRSC